MSTRGGGIVAVCLSLAILGCGGPGDMAQPKETKKAPEVRMEARSSSENFSTDEELGSVSRGERILLREGCLNCHTYRGRGTPTPGPPLDGAGKKHGFEWHLQHLKDPTSKNPDSTMPDYAHLPQEDLETLARWLASLE